MWKTKRSLFENAVVYLMQMERKPWNLKVRSGWQGPGRWFQGFISWIVRFLDHWASRPVWQPSGMTRVLKAGRIKASAEGTIALNNLLRFSQNCGRVTSTYALSPERASSCRTASQAFAPADLLLRFLSTGAMSTPNMVEALTELLLLCIIWCSERGWTARWGGSSATFRF